MEEGFFVKQTENSYEIEYRGELDENLMQNYEKVTFAYSSIVCFEGHVVQGQKIYRYVEYLPSNIDRYLEVMLNNGIFIGEELEENSYEELDDLI